MREARRKKRRRTLRLIIFLLGCYVVLVVLLGLINADIKNIYVRGNHFLTDQAVIDAAKLTDYPSFYENNFMVIKRRLEKNPYIKDAKVTVAWGNKVYIKVVENKRLFLNKDTGKIVLSIDSEVANDHQPVPILNSYVPKSKYKQLITEMSKLDYHIIEQISDITYVPNEVDDERFMLNMVDRNVIYINIIRFEKLNKYDSIKTELNNNTGILNLDYGTNFEVKNW